MLDGLRYCDGLLLVNAIVEALGAGDLELAGHRDEAIPVQIEPIPAGRGDGKEVRRVGLLPDEDVPGPRRYGDDLHVGAILGGKRIRKGLPHRLALIASTAADTAAIVLHLRVDDPIATNFLNKRRFGLRAQLYRTWDWGYPTLQMPSMHMLFVPSVQGVPSSTVEPQLAIIVSSTSLQNSLHGLSGGYNLFKHHILTNVSIML